MAPTDPQHLYQTIFKVAQYFLTQAKFYTIEQLREFDPSFDEVAKHARLLASNLTTLGAMGAWDEERIALNAQQACLLMERIALAITKGTEDKLQEAVSELDRMTFI
ncbi:hypothetical protein ACET89_16955 [Aeromonas veronii]